MTYPDLPWTGTCRCGDVRFAVSEPPMLTSVCHCTGCQSMTASAFSTTITVPTAGFKVTQGEAAIGGLGGPVARHHHCPKCMSWLFTRVEPDMGFVNVRATALDDHGWFAPFLEVWTDEALPWVTTPALHSYETQPAYDEYAALIEAYQNSEGRSAP